MKEISGYTRLVGLIANPIKHSLSPKMHNEAFEKLGLDYVYLAFEVEKEGLKNAIGSIRVLDMLGSNISMPYKEEVIKYLDELSPEAKLIGAVNTIVNDKGKLIGHITDGIGFMKSLRSEGIDPTGKKIVIVGAGGAATAITVQAALDKTEQIDIFNVKDEYFDKAIGNAKLVNERTECKATAYDLDDIDVLKEKMEQADIFINATGVGMKPLENESVIKDSALLREDLVVCDVVYYPKETLLIKMAKEKGCKVVYGSGMMLYQGAYAFELWTGKEMPI